MNDKTTHEFKIHLDDGVEEPEGAVKPSKEKKGASRNGHGGTSWITYALIAAIIVIMFAGYLDVRNRLLSFHSSGSEETKHLSEDIGSKFSNLSTKLTELESSLNKLSELQTGLGNSLSSLGEGLSKSDKSISSLGSSKADKKSVASSLAEIKKELSALTQSLKKNTADTAVMSAKLNATLAEVNNTTDKFLEEQNTIKITLEAVRADKASKKDLLTEIDHVENVLKSNQDKSDKQMEAILTSIQQLDIRTRALEAKTGLTSTSESEPIITDSNSISNEETNKNQSPVLSKPGELIERDISH